MPRTVVLRHDLPDGSHHFDWLIEPANAPTTPTAPEDRVLIAWRLAMPPATAVGSALTATRMPDHRRRYLEYEGPISGDRGSVRRVESGHAEILTDEPERFAAVVSLAGVTLCVEGHPGIPPTWRLRFSSPDADRPAMGSEGSTP